MEYIKLFEDYNKVDCKCGWSWNIDTDDTNPYLCHKCGYDNKEGKYYKEEKEINEKAKTKGEKTKKGKHVPSKYLTKNKSAMKKEIDKFRGTSSYKKDWDADYKSGEGGKGKRYKTKKSAATKAYEKKFGKKK